MNSLRASIGGIVLSGAVAIAVAAPALAVAPGDPTHRESVTVRDAAAVSKAKKLKKLKAVTGTSERSSLAWWEFLSQHQAGSNGANKYRFNWSTDGCTDAPDELPGGYNLHWDCARHDFGYRNYKKLVGKRKFRSEHKERIDKAFLGDMRRTCKAKPWSDPLPPATRRQVKKACLKTADKYYAAVRVLG